MFMWGLWQFWMGLLWARGSFGVEMLMELGGRMGLKELVQGWRVGNMCQGSVLILLEEMSLANAYVVVSGERIGEILWDPRGARK